MKRSSIGRPLRRPRAVARSTGRNGIASILALLFLVLFSTLAVGCYATSTLSAQIARNERSIGQAQFAAEGGMHFVRYQLGGVALAPGVPTDQYLSNVASQLAVQLNGTSNMNGSTVQISNGVIYLPSATGWTTLDANVGTRFRAQITQSGQFLVVTVTGCGSDSAVRSAIQLQFQKAPHAASILNYGIATKGTVTTSGAAAIMGATDPTKGSILSADTTNATPVIIDGKQVSGDISIADPLATVSVASGSSVGGTSNPAQISSHIHVGVAAPVFPWVDTSIFTAYATNPYVPGSTTLNNVYIPPGTNPKLASNTTINGVLWIQSPNVVTFKGNATINGVIVTDTAGSFNATTNQINFGGNVSATPIQNLPTTNPAYDPNLVKLTGSFILAPNYDVTFTGSFGTIAGSIVAGEVSMSGNASGTMAGSIIGMQDVPMTISGSADVIISGTGTSNYPSGLTFGNCFSPLPGTYIELTPP